MFSLISLVDSARLVTVKIIVINGDSTNWFSASTTTYTHMYVSICPESFRLSIAVRATDAVESS